MHDTFLIRLPQHGWVRFPSMDAVRNNQWKLRRSSYSVVDLLWPWSMLWLGELSLPWVITRTGKRTKRLEATVDSFVAVPWFLFFMRPTPTMSPAVPGSQPWVVFLPSPKQLLQWIERGERILLMCSNFKEALADMKQGELRLVKTLNCIRSMANSRLQAPQMIRTETETGTDYVQRINAPMTRSFAWWSKPMVHLRPAKPMTRLLYHSHWDGNSNAHDIRTGTKDARKHKRTTNSPFRAEWQSGPSKLMSASSFDGTLPFQLERNNDEV